MPIRGCNGQFFTAVLVAWLVGQYTTDNTEKKDNLIT